MDRAHAIQWSLPLDQKGRRFADWRGVTMLRRPSVEQRTGLSTSQLYREIRSKAFPPPYRITAGNVAWREDEVEAWMSRLRRAPA